MKRLWKKPVIGICPWRAVAMDMILAEVAERHGIPREDILGPRRRIPFVMARQEAMFEIVASTTFSLPKIGKWFSRDHTTILGGVRAHCKRNGIPLPRQIRPKGSKAWIELRAAA